MDNIPQMTPAIFKELLKSVKPLEIHGPVPQTPGITKEQTDDKLDEAPAEEFKHFLGDQDMVWFTLAPVYYALKADFSLTKEFAGKPEGKDALQLTLKVPYPVTPSIPGWENVVQGIDREHWEQLKFFLSPAVFNRGDNWWMLHGQTFPFRDPNHNKEFDLSVFTPVGKDQGVYPWYDMLQGSVKFYRGPGSPLVEQHAQLYMVAQGADT